MAEPSPKKQKVVAPAPQATKFFGYHHVEFNVSNALQTAAFWVSRFGFDICAYRGLETGSRDVVTHVVKQGQVIFAFSSPLNPTGEVSKQMGHEISVHGDGVKDIAYDVQDCRSVYTKAVERGAKSISAPKEYSDEHGTVLMATISAYADTEIGRASCRERV